MQMVNLYEKIKEVFLFLISVLSLDRPSSRIIMVIFCSLVLIFVPIHLIPLFSIYSKLGLYELLGFEFYSSGMTRALVSLYSLDFVSAYNHNYLVFVFIVFLIILFLLDIYRFFFRGNSNNLFNKK